MLYYCKRNAKTNQHQAKLFTASNQSLTIETRMCLVISYRIGIIRENQS